MKVALVSTEKYGYLSVAVETVLVGSHLTVLGESLHTPLLPWPEPS